MVQDNELTARFKGNLVDGGQGIADSDFGFLVAAPAGAATTVDIYRVVPGGTIKEKTVVVAGGSSSSVLVPWQSIGTGVKFGIGASGLRRYGYRIVTDRPVVVHQFNSLNVYQPTTTTCTSDSSCNPLFDQDQACFDIPVGKRCVYPAFTQDSSLLLPTHALGTSYVVTTIEHASFVSNTDAGTETQSGVVTIVATQAATTVTVRVNAATSSGFGVTASTKGTSQTFTLEPYDVLQISTRTLAGSAWVDCAPNPFGGTNAICREDNDLSGSVITADKPIAVFSGSPCALRPTSANACDHVEEQLAPVSAWGKSFVMQPSAPLRQLDGGFSSPAGAAPDHWKVVAACPASLCPTGTLITMSTAPFAADVLAPNRCLTGTLAANNCRLAGGAVMEFRSKQTVTLTADQPVQLVQFLTGQSATQGSPAQGDPSMMLQAPVEQWVSQTTVVVPPQFQDSYLAFAWDDTKTASVLLDGVAIAPGSAPGTFKVRTVPVAAGVHTVTTVPQAGQIAGVGVVTYGFAPFVSYGSIGGQRYAPLTTIVP